MAQRGGGSSWCGLGVASCSNNVEQVFKNTMVTSSCTHLPIYPCTSLACYLSLPLIAGFRQKLFTFSSLLPHFPLHPKPLESGLDPPVGPLWPRSAPVGLGQSPGVGRAGLFHLSQHWHSLPLASRSICFPFFSGLFHGLLFLQGASSNFLVSDS